MMTPLNLSNQFSRERWIADHDDTTDGSLFFSANSSSPIQGPSEYQLPTRQDISQNNLPQHHMSRQFQSPPDRIPKALSPAMMSSRESIELRITMNNALDSLRVIQALHLLQLQQPWTILQTVGTEPFRSQPSETQRNISQHQQCYDSKTTPAHVTSYPEYIEPDVPITVPNLLSPTAVSRIVNKGFNGNCSPTRFDTHQSYCDDTWNQFTAIGREDVNSRPFPGNASHPKLLFNPRDINNTSMGGQQSMKSDDEKLTDRQSDQSTRPSSQYHAVQSKTAKGRICQRSLSTPSPFHTEGENNEQFEKKKVRYMRTWREWDVNIEGIANLDLMNFDDILVSGGYSVMSRMWADFQQWRCQRKTPRNLSSNVQRKEGTIWFYIKKKGSNQCDKLRFTRTDRTFLQIPKMRHHHPTSTDIIKHESFFQSLGKRADFFLSSDWRTN